MEPRCLPSPVSHAYVGAAGLTLLTWHEPPMGTTVPEAVVHDLWSRQAFRTPLRLVDGRRLDVVAPGRLNTGGGPDFADARLRLDGMLVAGDVELHVRSSDWNAHRHETDPRYDRVALHVVLHDDRATGRLCRPDGSLLPELVLAPFLTEPLRKHAPRPRSSTPALPCAWGFPALPDADLRAWIRTLARLRLRRRVREVEAAGPNFERTLLARTARTLGYRANADAFSTLAERLPSGLLARLPDPLDREAVLFGVAGLLPPEAHTVDSDEAKTYVRDLHTRLQRLPMDAVPLRSLVWNRARLRPAATPELRLAQLAALTCPTGFLGCGGAVALARSMASPDALPRLLAALTATPGPFWTTHYRFDREAAPHSSSLGADTVAALIVNALLPVAVAAGATEDQALRILDALPMERDAVTAQYALPRHGVRPTAAVSQALHEWSEAFCTPGRCLECPTGKALLRG